MAQPALLAAAGIDQLIATLEADGYRVLGPVVRDGVVRMNQVHAVADFPAGWTDRHAGGSYHLERRQDQAVFAFNVGPDSAKTSLFPSRRPMWSYDPDTARFDESPDDSAPVAFIGLRACDVAAIAVQDRVLMEGTFVDGHYSDRRRAAVVIAVNCTEAGATCFCTSMGSGPRAEDGFDLALTELVADGIPEFLVEVGSERGAALLAGIDHRPAPDAAVSAAEAAIQRARGAMGRHLATDGIKELLYANATHPRWDDVAARCLTCANCTMACPTCFCTTPIDTSALGGGGAARAREWASCFSLDFSYMGGEPVRASAAGRYRQWMTHKLASWIDQFGTSGCVGCGRCITWCPVGIDITEEVAAIRDTDLRQTIPEGAP